MSEHEDLQKAVKESKGRTQMERISNYLDDLMARIDSCHERERSSWIIYAVAWGSWVLSAFFNENHGSTLMGMVFIVALMYQSTCTTITRRALGEFIGAIKILEILGMIPPMSGGNNRRKRSVWNDGIDMVKMWAAHKKQVQEKVYSPA